MSETLLEIKNLHAKAGDKEIIKGLDPVSYTHLTLPTKLVV